MSKRILFAIGLSMLFLDPAFAAELLKAPSDAELAQHAAVIDPGMVPLAMLGSTAPDWLEWIGGTAAGRKVKHRTVTHVLLTWLTAAAFFGFASLACSSAMATLVSPELTMAASMKTTVAAIHTARTHSFFFIVLPFDQ